jgi:hypothetical protein
MWNIGPYLEFRCFAAIFYDVVKWPHSRLSCRKPHITFIPHYKEVVYNQGVYPIAPKGMCQSVQLCFSTFRWEVMVPREPIWSILVLYCVLAVV